jgi:hypothetical protein
MIAQSRPLIDGLAEIPDFCKARGKRHELKSILALACCAILYGYRSYSAIAEWGRPYGHRFPRTLDFTDKPPSASTLHTIFKGVGVEVFEAKLGAWAEGLTAGLSTSPEAAPAATAIAGKTLRGSKKQGVQGCTCFRPYRIILA